GAYATAAPRAKWGQLVNGRRRRLPALRRQPRLLEIEVALDDAHRVLAQPALVAQAEDRVALDADKLPAQRAVALDRVVRALCRAPVVAVATADDRHAAPEARAVQLAHAAQPLLGD